MTRSSLLLFAMTAVWAGAAGCHFQVAGIDTDAEAAPFDLGDADAAIDFAPPDDLPVGADLSGADLAQPDLGVLADLTVIAPTDLTSLPDLTALPDLTVLPDLAAPPDLTPPPDLTAPPDLTPVIFPSHVPARYLDDSATDWLIAADTTIDTSANSAATAISPAPPAGVVYAIEGSFAVIAVRNLTLGANANSTVRVTVVGSRPLVIVAGGAIVINGTLDAGGHGSQPGPAGAAPSMGAGAGNDGAGSAKNGTGGGGAGYGTAGAAGGGAVKMAPPNAAGAAGGATYGSATLTTLLGGSGGGNGNGPNGENFLCPSSVGARGGAGGGALQLSARTSISVAGVHFIPFAGIGGVVNVGGGGGALGCGGSSRSGSGGGGGSGGALLVEAPTVNVSGVLGGSGGGGGGGGGVTLFVANGSAGHDALDIGDPTTSSRGGNGARNDNAGGKGSNTVVNTGDATPGNPAATVDSSGGGGGGGYGRIFVRSSGPPTISLSSPAATTDPSLPATIP